MVLCFFAAAAPASSFDFLAAGSATRRGPVHCHSLLTNAAPRPSPPTTTNRPVFIGFGGFAMATLVLVFLEDDAVDFGIAAGQVDFAQSMRTFCTLLHIAPFAPSLGSVKLLLAVVAGVVTTLLFFPQLSIAKSSVRNTPPGRAVRVVQSEGSLLIVMLLLCCWNV